MWEYLRFSGPFPFLAVVMPLFILSLLVLWFETKRDGRFQPLKLAAVLLVAIGAAGIFLRPLYKGTSSRDYVLLTQGTDEAVVDSLKKIHSAIRFLNAAPDRFTETTRIASWHELEEKGKRIRFVVGHGLPEHATAFIKSDFTFMKSSPPGGVVSISLPGEMYPDEKIEVSGLLRGSGTQPVVLILEGPAGREDSLVVYGAGATRFTLRFRAQQPGRYLYKLLVRTDAGSSVVGNLPATVEERQPIDVIILQSYPSFELQFLKQYLGTMHRVFVRSQLSKGRFRTEYLNGAEGDVNLTKAVMERAELVITDAETINSLSPEESRVLLQGVRNGLGLILLPGGQPDTKIRNWPQPFTLIPVKKDTVMIGAGKQRVSIKTAPFRLSGEALIETGLLNGVQGYRYEGTGRIGVQLATGTFPLILRGDSAIYSSLWYPLIKSVTRPAYGNKVIVTSRFPHFPGEPLNFRFLSSGTSPELYFDSVHIPLREDANIDGLWQGTVWPSRDGWHQLLSVPDSSRTDIFVSSPGEWQALEHEFRRSITSLRGSAEGVRPKGADVWVEVNPLIFYLLLLSGCAALWLIPKLA